MNKKQILFNKLIKKVGSQNKLAHELGYAQCTLSIIINNDNRFISRKLGTLLQDKYGISKKIICDANNELQYPS